MKQQNIEKIIEQVEACKRSLKELARTVSETTTEEDATADQIDAAAELLTYCSAVNMLAHGGIAQLEYIKELITDINKEDKE